MTFALIVAVTLCIISAALYCQSDVRPPAQVDDQASPFGRVEALPVERPARPSAGENSERTRIAAAVPGSVVAAGEPPRTPAATPTDPFTDPPVHAAQKRAIRAQLRAERARMTPDELAAEEAARNEGTWVVDGVRYCNFVIDPLSDVLHPITPTPRQLHPSTYSERWWAQFQSQPLLVPRRHLTVVEHANRLARAFTEPIIPTDGDPTPANGMERPA